MAKKKAAGASGKKGVVASKKKNGGGGAAEEGSPATADVVECPGAGASSARARRMETRPPRPRPLPAEPALLPRLRQGRQGLRSSASPRIQTPVLLGRGLLRPPPHQVHLPGSHRQAAQDSSPGGDLLPGQAASKPSLRLARHVRYYALAKRWIKSVSSKDKEIAKKDLAAYLKGIKEQLFDNPEHHSFKSYPHAGNLRHSCSYLDDFQTHDCDSFSATLASLKGVPKITVTLAHIFRNEEKRPGGERAAVTAALQTMEDLSESLVAEVEANPVLRCSTLAEVQKAIGRNATGWIATRAACSVSSMSYFTLLRTNIVNAKHERQPDRQ